MFLSSKWKNTSQQCLRRKYTYLISYFDIYNCVEKKSYWNIKKCDVLIFVYIILIIFGRRKRREREKEIDRERERESVERLGWGGQPQVWYHISCFMIGLAGGQRAAGLWLAGPDQCQETVGQFYILISSAAREREMISNRDVTAPRQIHTYNHGTCRRWNLRNRCVRVQLKR